MAHLCDTACVIRDGAVCVYCYGDTRGGQHADCCQGDTVYTCKVVCYEDTYSYEQDRNGCGQHTYGDTRDDVGSRSGLG